MRVVTGELNRILMIVCLLKKSVHDIACIVISIIILKQLNFSHITLLCIPGEDNIHY